MNRVKKLVCLLLSAAALPAIGLTGCSSSDEAGQLGESQEAATVQDSGFTDSIVVSGISSPTRVPMMNTIV